MTPEQQKARAFLARLLSNPALAPLAPLQKEEQVLQFLSVNQQALLPTLRAPAFFPGRRTEEIESILSQALALQVDEMLVASLESLVSEELDLAFLSLIPEGRVPLEKCRAQILDALKRGLAKPDFRRSLSGATVAFSHRLVARYIAPCLQRREYVHFELTKVQHLTMGAEEIRAFVEATMLLRPLVHSAATEGIETEQEGPVVVTDLFASKVLRTLSGQYKMIPAPLLRSALQSSVSFYENNRLDATSRLAALFSARGRNYRPLAKVDRGADAPDQSWFRVARRNAKAHGLDVKMVDELYRVAADNGW